MSLFLNGSTEVLRKALNYFLHFGHEWSHFFAKDAEVRLCAQSDKFGFVLLKMDVFDIELVAIT